MEKSRLLFEVNFSKKVFLVFGESSTFTGGRSQGKWYNDPWLNTKEQTANAW